VPTFGGIVFRTLYVCIWLISDGIYISTILLSPGILSQIPHLVTLPLPYLLDVSKTVLGTLLAMWLFQKVG
jgi:hypothetical protein